MIFQQFKLKIMFDLVLGSGSELLVFIFSIGHPWFDQQKVGLGQQK